MATVVKDFKVKNGLIVEGSSATVNNFDILTKKTDDQNYIVNLIGGTATSANEADKVVKRDANGDFAAGEITADIVGDVTGNADTATALETGRTITLAGDVTGSVSFDGTANVSITATIDGSFATDAEVATAKGEAIADAATDATSKANAAQSAATTAAATDATTKANAAQSAAISTAAGDATTKADAAQAAAISTAAGDATTKADAAQAAAIAHADALDTDDVAEGTAQYFTDARAKTSAASLLTGATLTNITISGNGSGLTITAENGVADSDTDDLTEGTSNLYFTDVRAVSALEAVTPDFPAVEIASIAKQVAAEASVATASTNTAVSWAKASYRSAEFLVKIANGSHTEVSKVILTLDTSDNVAITEYAMVGTNGSLGSVSADVSGDDVRLRVTTVNNTSVVGVVGTLIK